MRGKLGSRRMAMAVGLVSMCLTSLACHPLLPQSPAGAPGSVVSEIPPPPGHEGWTWYRTPARTPGRNLTFAVRQARGVPKNKTVLVLHASSGLSQRDLWFADLYAAHGFTAVVGCWFNADHPGLIPCYNEPEFTGQSGAAQQDVSAIVNAVQLVLPQPLALVGISRGAGVAGLRAKNHDEPIVLLSCLCTQPLHPFWGPHPDDHFPFDVIPQIDAPTYVWSAADDVITPPHQQSDWFVLGMQVYGKDVTYSKYQYGGHAFMLDPELGSWTVAVTSGWIEEKLS